MLYEIIYALAARDGREAALFGDCAPLAREAFVRSLATDSFPELWFELPLKGEPWFDFHALTSREDLRSDMEFSSFTTGGYPEAFACFAAQDLNKVRQLALSWDISSGSIEHPAVQLLVRRKGADATCRFLESVGRADAAGAYRRFLGLLPSGWFACYTGVFPGRPEHNLRVECIPDATLQDEYASNLALLEQHLRQLGFRDFGDTLLSRCHELAQMPFNLEFQFDVTPEGRAGATLGASLRFAQPQGEDDGCRGFDVQGPAGDLMRRIEAWGLADDRWRLVADTAFVKRAAREGESSVLYCYPAFIKLRWHGGEPIDAKAYLIAGAE